LVRIRLIFKKTMTGAMVGSTARTAVAHVYSVDEREIMGTSTQEIRNWFNQGVRIGATHMIVVCDTFDYEDYPVYVEPDKDAQELVDALDGSNMRRVMEVYNLSMDREEQLSQHRVFNF
jgi:hypothetical protein